MVRNRLLVTIVLFVLNVFIAKADIKPPVADAIKDKFIAANYDNSQASLEGYIGERMRINLEKRLLALNLPAILEP